MANAEVTIKRVEFVLDEELTHCNVFYTSSEPGIPWGGGWKTKAFPASKPIIDILEQNISEFIMWEGGRK